MAGTSILAKLAVQIVANAPGFQKTMQDATKSLDTFTKNFRGAAAAVGVGFGISEISQFAIETARLAGQAEAVKTAFDKLPQATRLMAQLKDVTRGTVSEFELMKSAVKASNFGIELSQLPRLLQFATLRAQQTGQSVDYLVESIIMGIGRKSPMILDNLGISLIRLREKLNGVGAEAASVAQMTKVVGDIASEELQNMAGFATNAATKMEQIAASWNDLKIKIGENLQQGNHYNDLLENIKNQLIVWNSSEVSFWTKLFSSAQEYQALVADIEMKQRIAAGAPGYGAISPQDFFANQIKQLKLFGEYAKNLANPPMDEKQLEELLKERESAFKRYGISISKINQATFEDLKRYDKQSADLLKTQINNYKALGDSTTKFGEQFGTTMDDAQQVIQSIVASGISLPDLIGRPEDIDYVINKFKELGKGTIETAGDISEAFRSAAEGGLNEFFMGFEQMAVKQITFGQNIINAISSFMRSFGQQLIALGTAKLGLDKLLASLTIPNAAVAIGAIAAGTALVAAAGAMKANNDLAIQKTVRTTSSGTGLRSMESANIQVTGTLVGSGRDLVAVINQTKYDNQIRRGG